MNALLASTLLAGVCMWQCVSRQPKNLWWILMFDISLGLFWVAFIKRIYGLD